VSCSLPDFRGVRESSGSITWGVVIPVKRLALAKSRLAPLGDDLRSSLALAFAADVVTAVREVAQALVITDDDEARQLLEGLGAWVEPDDPDAGLNPALSHGADLLRATSSIVGVAALSADLPALRAPDLAAVLRRVSHGQRGYVPDRTGRGTTLLAAGPGAALDPCFGPGSAAAHEHSGADRLIAPESVRWDVDTPEDLEHAVGLGVGPWTSRLLAPLP
jgi:2-phospho-L-lactate guanylyltransferase